jgi:hypothetical protein
MDLAYSYKDGGWVASGFFGRATGNDGYETPPILCH